MSTSIAITRGDDGYPAAEEPTNITMLVRALEPLSDRPLNQIIDILREQFDLCGEDKRRQATHVGVDRRTWDMLDRKLLLLANPVVSCLHVIDGDAPVCVVYRPV